MARKEAISRFLFDLNFSPPRNYSVGIGAVFTDYATWGKINQSATVSLEVNQVCYYLIGVKLQRYKNNPIIAPTRNWWEINATFNAGATIFEGKVILLYRAIGGDNLSRFGLAVSRDGANFERFEDPAFEAELTNQYERLGVEDPRIVKIDDTYYITYTAPSVSEAAAYRTGKFAPSLNHPAPWRVRPSLVTTRDFKKFEREGIILEKDTKNTSLFPEKINGRFCLLHRIYPQMYIIFSTDLNNWQDEAVLISPRNGFWDSERVGAGAQPIKSEKGWLLFYHGTDGNHIYRLGVLLLDLTDPTKVLYRSPEPILEPTETYERVGLTPNVVFTCGAVEKDDQYFVYYGAADKVIGLATISKDELLSNLR